MYSVPGLENYPGCKGGSGVYQKIISVIPPFETLIIPFLGHCGITRNIRPGNTHIYIDASCTVIENWLNYLTMASTFIIADGSHGEHYTPENTDAIQQPKMYTLINTGTVPQTGMPEKIILIHGDAIAFLQNYKAKPTDVIYCDPPYPHETRKDLDLYTHEFTNRQHRELLEALNKIEAEAKKSGFTANVLLSTYQNPLYEKSLQQWNKLQFQAMTRGGVRTETLYYCHDLKNGMLHDFRYLGKNYKDRERIKLKIDRWVAGLEKLEPAERMAIVTKITNKIPLPAGFGT